MRKQPTSESARREAWERLYPSITNPNWLILRARRNLFANWLKSSSGTSLRVLDVGGRLQPYRPLLNDRVREYYSVDIVSGSFVNAVGTAEELPFASCQFDLVFCTQMLEYVPRPQQAVDEIYRVLRPGGYLLLSAPAVFPRDSEVEYWRFLPSALRLLLRDFSELEIAPEGSTITGLLRTINVSLIAFSPRPARTIFKYTVVPVLNVIAVLLDKTVHSRNDQLTANFSAFARK